MSLADAITKAPLTRTPIRKGPPPGCDIYGEGTVEDFRAVDARRKATTWAEAQATVDRLLGITTPIKLDMFRYHWRGRCSHFDAIRGEL
jgi:hypothetical protein